MEFKPQLMTGRYGFFALMVLFTAGGIQRLVPMFAVRDGPKNGARKAHAMQRGSEADALIQRRNNSQQEVVNFQKHSSFYEAAKMAKQITQVLPSLDLFKSGDDGNGEDAPALVEQTPSGKYDFVWKGYAVFIEVTTPAITEAFEAAQSKIGDIHKWAPHVAIASNIDPTHSVEDIMKKLKAICGNIPATELVVDQTRFADEGLKKGGWKFGDWKDKEMRFFQVEFQSTNALTRLHKEATTMYPSESMSMTGNFLPHLALVMTTFEDPRFTMDDANTIIGESGKAIFDEKIPVTKIALYKTDGHIGEWTKVGDIPLLGGKGAAEKPPKSMAQGIMQSSFLSILLLLIMDSLLMSR